LFSPTRADAAIQIEGAITTGTTREGVPKMVVEWWVDNRAADTTLTDAAGFFRFRGSWSDQQHHELRVLFPTREPLRIPIDRDHASAETKVDKYVVRARIAAETGTAVPITGPDAPAPLPPGSQAVIRVFYATDRIRTAMQPLAYGNDRADGGKLHLGHFDVSVPREHTIGVLERPRFWTYRQDPANHFTIVDGKERSYDDFYREVTGIVDQSTRHEAFVFVHGYNVPFDSAIFRTAQIAHDLQFDGAPILYSWPSRGNPLAYPDDANNSDWTVPHLQWFLQDVALRTRAQRIHVIAHSMGNRSLVQALYRIAKESGPLQRPVLSQILLTAPDIDADTFVELAAAVRTVGQRVTLYASARDNALKASKTFQGYRRAGDTQPTPTVVPGIDTIDVSAVDTSYLGLGHSYYGSNRSVLSDIFRLLRDGAPPQERFGIAPPASGPRTYWVFRP
jgi:esterase/lipase superfamily enzyme